MDEVLIVLSALRERVQEDMEAADAEMTEAHETLVLMTDWGELDVAKEARAYCQLLAAKHGLIQEQFQASHEIVNHHYQQIKISQTDSNLKMSGSLTEAVNTSSRLLDLKAKIDALVITCEAQRTKLTEVSQHITRKLPPGRSRTLRGLVLSVPVIHEEEKSCLLDISDAAQVRFNTLIMDTRSREGQILKRWLTTVDSAEGAHLGAEGVLRMIRSFAAMVAGTISLPRHLLPRLSVFVERLIFPRVWRHIIPQSIALDHADQLFRVQITWLRRCHASELGVAPIYTQVIARGGFSRAVDLLNEMELHSAPSDMLIKLYLGAHAVYEAMVVTINELEVASSSTALNSARGAKIEPLPTPTDVSPQLGPAEVAPNSPGLTHTSAIGLALPNQSIIGADQFFPNFLWACVHAELVTIHTTLSTLKQFISADDRITEVGYYLTCLEGVAEFVNQVDPQQLHAMRTDPVPTPIA